MDIFEKFGLKEVANVTFYEVGSKKPVLYLDTLKVSTIEQTADNVDAKGGVGNPTLITWDYNKAVTLTLEDALFSSASLKLMTAAAIEKATSGAKSTIDFNEELYFDGTGAATLTYTPAGKVSILDEDGVVTELTAVAKGITHLPAASSTARVFYGIEVDGTTGEATNITINANTFPSTYRVVGETVVRSSETGKDEAFQFIVEKAKVNSNVTFTMQAEGDPSTFTMTLKVLKDDKGNMFKLVKYNLPTISA